MTADETISIVCFKWGAAYPSEHVNILRDCVKKYLPYPFEFYCFTDDAAGIDEDIIILTSEFLASPPRERYGGGWPKLATYQKGVLPPDRITFLMDLDIVILGSLVPFVERIKEYGGGLHIVRQMMNPLGETLLPLRWRRNRGGNSSFVAFYPHEQYHIYDKYLKVQDTGYRTKGDYRYFSDQRFVSQHAHDVQFWDSNLVKIFRRQCVPMHFWGKPKPIAQPSCPVVVFPGSPNPSDLCRDDVGAWGRGRRCGFGPVDWVQKNWRRWS